MLSEISRAITPIKTVAMGEDGDKILYGNFLSEQYNDDDDDDTSSVNTDIPSEPWFGEKDVISSTPKSDFKDVTPNNNDISYSILYGKELDESKLKEEEVDLYHDLDMNEHTGKLYIQKLENELEKLKKEIKNLQDAVTVKSTRIEELTTENKNLKINICSLYKTAKTEIDYKDQLLTEANRKLDKLMFSTNGLYFRQNHRHEESDNRLHKRKRSKSPEPLNDKRSSVSCTAKIDRKDALQDKNRNQSNLLVSKERDSNKSQKSDNRCVSYQTPRPRTSAQKFMTLYSYRKQKLSLVERRKHGLNSGKSSHS